MRIVKYENRKLYSKTHGRYVTYIELVTHVSQGNQIQVTCNTTKNDITTDILKKCVEYKKNLYQEDLYSLLRK